jgi:hypothetical protein
MLARVNMTREKGKSRSLELRPAPSNEEGKATARGTPPRMTRTVSISTSCEVMPHKLYLDYVQGMPALQRQMRPS